MAFAATWWCLLFTAPTLLMSQDMYEASDSEPNYYQQKRGSPYDVRLPVGYVVRNVDPSTDVLLEPYEEEADKRTGERNRFQFGLGKRQPYSSGMDDEDLQGRMGRYGFGLGKRSTNAREAEEAAIDEMKRGASKFNFGLGKRAKSYSFGLGKKWDDGDRGFEDNLIEDYKRAKTYGFGLGKRDEDFMDEEKRSRPYQFGLGKRDRSYSFGLGKRMEDEKKNMKYAFGLGKRDEEKRNRNYGFGIGKRSEAGDEKRSKNYGFGLGKKSEGTNYMATSTTNNEKKLEKVGKRILKNAVKNRKVKLFWMEQ